MRGPEKGEYVQEEKSEGSVGLWSEGRKEGRGYKMRPERVAEGGSRLGRAL